MKRIAIYARVSDDKKKPDGERRQDVDRQIELIKDFLKRKGDDDPQIYIDDGKSAFTEDWNQRPAFKQLFNNCKRHFIKEIYIEDMTRFSRRLDLGLQWLRDLAELNVNLTSLKEGELEVTSSKGWMQSSMLLMFSEWDSRIKSEKVKSGMARAKEAGKHIGRAKSHPPFPIENKQKTTL